MSAANNTSSHIDEWDEFAPRRFYRPLPAMSLSEAISRETQSVFITGELSKDEDGDRILWWLSEPGVQGQSTFASLLKAKNAGNQIVDAAYAAKSDKIVKDAGLDPAQWIFVDKDDIRFDNTLDKNVAITRNSKTDWQLWQDAAAPLGAYPSPKAAADAYAAIPASGL